MSPKTTPSAARVSAAAAVRPPDGPPSPRAPAPSPCDGLAGPRAPGRSLCEPVAADEPSVTLTAYRSGARPSEQSKAAPEQAAAVRAAGTPAGHCGPGMPPGPSTPASGSRSVIPLPAIDSTAVVRGRRRHVYSKLERVGDGNLRLAVGSFQIVGDCVWLLRHGATEWTANELHTAPGALSFARSGASPRAPGHTANDRRRARDGRPVAPARPD